MENEIEKSIFTDLQIPELSETSKIFLIGRYLELFCRFALNVPDNRDFELKNSYLVFKDDDGLKYFEKAFNAIKKIRNKCVHTKNKHVATKEEFETAKENLNVVYATLFYKFFLKYGFGENKSIVSVFSLLPPKIRVITLERLLLREPNNLLMIEKDIVAKIKADDYEGADKTIELFKGFLEQNYYYEDLVQKKEVLKSFHESTKNQKISYSNLPEAGAAYKSHREEFANSTEPDMIEFISIMDFVYRGF